MRSPIPTPVLVLWGLVALLLSCRSGVSPLAPHYPAKRSPAPVAAPVPSVPPSVSLTASDGTGLELLTIDARVVIEDPLAFTELELWFQNPHANEVEGRFEILLPQQAQVTRFAMQVGSELQEAEVVEKQYARQAYEASVHEQRDPALLERDTGNRFRARVYPIEAYERKRIILSYAQSLPDPDEPYRLATRGLPWLQRLDLRAQVLNPERGTHQIVHTSVVSQQPTRDIVIPRPTISPGGIRRGEHVIARVDPLAGADPGEAQPFRRLTVLFDTSASRALEHDQAVEALGRLLRALSRHSGTAKLQILAFDQQVVPIYDGPLGSMGSAPLTALHTRRPLGASDLEAALGALEEGERDRVLLVSDGLISAGTESDAELRRMLGRLARRGVERLDVLRVGSVRDDPRLRRLATGPLPQAGVLLDAEGDLERAAERLVLPTMDGLRIDVPGARWWRPQKLEGLQPGDHVLVHAELPEGQPMTVQVTGPVHTEHTIELHEVDSPLVDHAWMQGRVESLIDRVAVLQDALESEPLRKLAVSLSVRHRIFNDFTAFLVLETEEDYARFGLDRRALSDILLVGPTGVTTHSRALPGWTEPVGREQAEVVDGKDIDHDEAGRRQAEGERGEDEPAEAEQADRGELESGGDDGGEATEELEVQVVEPMLAPEPMPAVLDEPDYDVRARRRPSRRGRVRERRRDRSGLDASVSPVADPSPAPAAPPAAPPPPPSGPSPLPPAQPPAVTDLPTADTATTPTVVTEDTVNVPVSTSRDFTQVVQTLPGASKDSAKITLAGTTGSEGKYVVEGANVSEPAFGTVGASVVAEYIRGPSWDPVPARMTMSMTSVQGEGLSRRDARRTLRGLESQLERCYFHALNHDGELMGRVRIKLRLDTHGGVSFVGKVRKRGLHDLELLRCLDEAFRDARFPSVAGRAPRVLTTLTFLPGDGPPGGYTEEPTDRGTPGDDAPPAKLAAIDRALAKRRNRDAWTMAWTWREAAPTDVLALVALGRAAEAAGRSELAARAYGSILDLFPSRADMRRYAAGELEALREPALALAVDAYQKAREQRPDHPSSHRNLAFALMRQGDAREAFAVLEAALERDYPPDRFAGVQRVLREDLGVVAAAWLRDYPTDGRRIQARLDALGATMATAPSLRFVLTWETDANDVDLHVVDAAGFDAYHEQPAPPSGGELFADVDNGYGPECFAVSSPAAGYPYRVRVHYFDRGPMGYGLGKVQILHHDGLGGLVVDDRPFVIVEDGAVVELGSVERAAAGGR